jgi:hypothetical protein
MKTRKPPLVRKAEVDRISRLWFVLALRPFNEYDHAVDDESMLYDQLRGLLDRPRLGKVVDLVCRLNERYYE